MKITVIGCGRWGCFLTWYTAGLGHKVTLFGRESSEHMKQIAQTRSNGMLTLPESVKLSYCLQEAVETAQIIIISISSQNLRSLMKQIQSFPLQNKTIVLCMKGIEVETGFRLTQIVRSFVPSETQVAVWVGPGHVQDFLQGIPNCMVIDSDRQQTKELLVKELSSQLIRFYYGNDLIGNEVGAAAKNVIGIAAGMLDGLHKTALKGALMARGAREIARLVEAMGGQAITVYGLSHLGDYQATVFSNHSHNRQFGEDFVLGTPYTKLAEGVPTTTALVNLAKKYKVDLPICNGVYKVLNHQIDPERVLSDIFLRSLKSEF